jgi:hypothetical protein
MIPSQCDTNRKTLDGLCADRMNLVREPWWSEARIVGDRRFVSSMVERRRQKKSRIVGLKSQPAFAVYESEAIAKLPLLS